MEEELFSSKYFQETDWKNIPEQVFQGLLQLHQE